MKAILGSMTFAEQVDAATATKMVDSFRHAGFDELDTAYVYCGGDTENLLGQLNREKHLGSCKIATKVNPSAGGLSPESIDKQFSTSLTRMDVSSVDLLYLHEPDLDTPIIKTLEAVQQHYDGGRFKRFGLSNYAAWQVAEINGLCAKTGFIKPTVYQGMYNALTRDVERELLPCLQSLGIAFYVYNPLAGGLLSGKHSNMGDLPDAGRFSANAQYQDRYWKEDYFAAMDAYKAVCMAEGIPPAEAALRWLVHHSDLNQSKGDGIVLGASSIEHFEQNLAALRQDALPQTVIDSLNHGWETARPTCIKYFRP